MTESEIKFQKASNLYDSKKYEEAKDLLVELCAENMPEALSLLGVMHQLGDGVEMSGKQAVSLLKRAVDLGQGVAAHNLGTIYSMGLPGIEVDHELSRHYYNMAKKMGAKFANDVFYR